MGASGEHRFPDGALADTIPLTLVVKDRKEQAARVAHYSTATGDLLVLGDIELHPQGSEHYVAPTPKWEGHPAGYPDPFRCMAGVLIPLRLKVRLDVNATEHRLVALANATLSEGAWKIRDNKGSPLGEVRFSNDTAFWPQRAEWVQRGGAACEVILQGSRGWSSPLLWGEGEERGMRRVSLA